MLEIEGQVVRYSTPSRRQFLRDATMTALGFAGAGLLSCKDNNAEQLEAERQKRISDYVRLEPSLQKLPRESTLIGGTWVRPVDPVTISTSDKLEIAAKAYAPTNEPPIQYVIFTATYPGAQSPDPADPDAWAILDVVNRPENGVYRLPQLANLKLLGLKPGDKMSLSFDAVNRNGQIKYAPQGIHDVYYKMRPRT